MGPAHRSTFSSTSAPDEPDIGMGEDPREALRAALAALGEPYASDMADGVELVDGRPFDT